jgi:hypothetical protein
VSKDEREKNMTMNAEIKAQWVAALRSGDYIQGKSRLATIRGNGTVEYCCLGVLCDVAVKSGLDIAVCEGDVTSGTTSGSEFAPLYYGDAAGLLPDSVVQWAGLESVAEEDSGGEYRVDIEVDGYTYDLAQMNDCGSTFAEIADTIAQHL